MYEMRNGKYPVILLLLVKVGKAATEERRAKNQKKVRKNGAKE